MNSPVQYNVIVKTPGNYDTYKVYSHSVENHCLILNFGKLEKSQGPNEMVIPVFNFDMFFTEDIDE